MFPLSPFLANTGAGRAAPAAPIEGAEVFLLGPEALGRVITIGGGDFFEVSQAGDLLTADPGYARLKLRVLAPAAPAGATWRLSVLFDGVERVGFDLPSPSIAEVLRQDVAVPLRGVAVTTRSRLAARLTLVAAAGAYSAELPAVAIDEVVLDPAPEPAARPTLINRVPEPGEQNVFVGSPVYLEINDPDAAAAPPGGSIDQANTQVFVGGTLAFDAGAFQAGFSGSSLALLDGDRTLALTIVPDVPFVDSAEVQVRVVARVVGLFATLDQTYSFLTQDLTAPRLTGAVAFDVLTVRVTASEPLLAADASAPEDALNPGSWLILLLSTSLDDGLPAVTPSVTSVTKVDDQTFDLGLSTEMTPGALYAAFADAGVSDLFGNPLAGPPWNPVPFTGYARPRPTGRRFDMLSWLPALNTAEDSDAHGGTRDLERFVKCLQEPADMLLGMVDDWPTILDPDVAPQRFVDAMLVDLGNPFRFLLDDVDARKLAESLVRLYALKGTDDGIIEMILFFLGIAVTISVPAFEGSWILGVSLLGEDTILGAQDIATRLSFYVVSPVVLTEEQRARITAIVLYAMRAECHFLGILEPAAPPALPDHWELGLSRFGAETYLH